MPEKENYTHGKPVIRIDRYSGASTTYQKVVSWRVGELWGLKHGRLDEISLVSDNYTKTRFRLRLMESLAFDELQIQSATTLPIRSPNELPYNAEVVVECRSTDGSSIAVNASITGVEF